MLKEFQYELVAHMAKLHGWIMQLNNSFEQQLSDRQLQILAVGILGMALYFALHPAVRFLARRGYEIVLSWLLVVLMLLVLLFGVEIGQLTTASSVMDFSDLTLGIAGFLGLFFLYAVIRGIIGAVRKLKCRVRRRK